jgi:hypothetical protein
MLLKYPQLFLASAVSLMIFFAAATRTSAAGVVTTIHEWKGLAQDQSSKGRSLHLSGVVVCYDSGWNQLYIYDGHETGYFNPHNFPTQPQPGEMVEVSGVVADENTLTNGQLTILHPGTIPEAKKLKLSELGNDWCEWIETDGRVLSAETSSGRLALLLQANSQNCLVYVLGGPLTTNDFKRFLGQEVRVRGINASKSIDGRLESASVFVPSMSEIAVLKTSSPKPAPVPVVSIGSLLDLELGSWTNSPVHINGIIVSYQPGKSLLVKDPTGVIRTRVIQHTQAGPDQRVDVWGFLEVSPTEAFLNNAYFEVSQPPQNDALAASPAIRRTPSPPGLRSLRFRTYLNCAAKSPPKIFPCACME